MKKALITLFLILFIWVQAVFSSTSRLKKIELEEVLAIGGPEEDTIFMWVDVTTDEEQNIYLVDLRDYSLKKFDQKGKLIKKAGRRGEGPGELNSPGLIRYANQRVYVAEIFKPGILVFDNNLEYLYRIPLTLPVRDFEIWDDEHLASTKLFADQEGDSFSHSLNIFDHQGRVTRKIIFASHTSFNLENSAEFKVGKDGNISLAYNWKDRVERRDREGNLIWSAAILGIKKIEKKTHESVGSYPTNIIYKAISQDVQGNLFILGGHLSRNRSRDIYILDKDGKQVSTITLPQPSHTIHIDEKNHLYAGEDEAITLKKYALKYLYE